MPPVPKDQSLYAMLGILVPDDPSRPYLRGVKDQYGLHESHLVVSQHLSIAGRP
jgi:hypothetical protein